MLSLLKHFFRAAHKRYNDVVELLSCACLSVRQAQQDVLFTLSGTRLHAFARPIILGLLALLALPAAAHVIDADLSKLSRTEVFWTYLQLGFTHILPLGFDHILFIVSLYILEPRLRPVLWQATAFTVAHSITLGLAMYGLIQPPTSVVEPIIALSILFVALENILITRLSPWRLAIVFGFGLVHGLGFASALTGLGLPRKDYFGSLVSFNVGVELGQVTIILLCWALVGRWAYGRPWYRARVVVPVSVVIGLVAAYWTVERLLV